MRQVGRETGTREGGMQSDRRGGCLREGLEMKLEIQGASRWCVAFLSWRGWGVSEASYLRRNVVQFKAEPSVEHGTASTLSIVPASVSWR